MGRESFDVAILGSSTLLWHNLPVRFSLMWILVASVVAGLAVALWAPWRVALPFHQSIIDPGAEATTDSDAANYGPSAVLSADGSRLAFL